jgi:hypothetical protein
MVGHNWGSQHAERWIWLHAMSFDAANETTWLDVVLARIMFVGRTTPWIASGGICLDGERVALGGASRARRTKITETPHGLDFILPGREMSVSGTVHAPQDRFVGWVYADPDGSEHDVVNCSKAAHRRPGRVRTRKTRVRPPQVDPDVHGTRQGPVAPSWPTNGLRWRMGER